MRRRKEETQEVEEVDEVAELSEKEQKKLKLKEGALKRKNAKRKDKVARWGGVVLLGLVMFIGFLLWVSGEMKNDTILPSTSVESGSVIVR